jgi:hypothetical protein
MFVQGASVERLLDEIARREPGFDLDDEIVAELRTAGLPEQVIRAMAERARPASPPAPVEPPVDAAPALDLLLNPDRRPGTPEVLRVTGEIALPDGGAGVPIEDVALFVVCLSPTHVPDHWRAASPLGRDFERMPRHRVLLFLDGARHTPRRQGDDLLELDLPERIAVALEPGASHDLMLGVALGAGGRYFLLAGDRRDGFVPGPAAELRATIRSGRGTAPEPGAIEVRFAPASEPAR